MGYGMLGSALFNFQNSYGASQVTSQWAVPILSESLVYTEEQIAEQGMYRRLGESPYHRGMQSVAGDVAMEAHPQAMGFMLRSAFGRCVSTSDTNFTTHVFNPAGSDFDLRAAVTPLSVEVYRDIGSAALYFDLLGNQVALSVANGELMNLTLGVIGGGFTRKANATPTYTDGAPFQWDQSSHLWNGAAILDIRNLTVTMANQLEAMHTLVNSRAPYKIKRTGMQTVEVTGSILFQQHSYWDWYLQGSEFPLKLHFAGASPNALTIDIPKLRLTDFSPSIAGPGEIEASFTGRAMFHADSNTACTVTLVNSQPWYVLGDRA